MSSCDNIRLQLKNLQSNGSSFWFCTKKYATISNKSKQVGTVCQALSKRHIKENKNTQNKINTEENLSKVITNNYK